MTPCQRCGQPAQEGVYNENFGAWRRVSEVKSDRCTFTEYRKLLCPTCLDRVWFACALALRAVDDNRPIASCDMPEGTPVETRTLCVMGEVAYPANKEVCNVNE